MDSTLEMVVGQWVMVGALMVNERKSADGVPPGKRYWSQSGDPLVPAAMVVL
jgi:hypothetical protein